MPAPPPSNDTLSLDDVFVPDLFDTIDWSDVNAALDQSPPPTTATPIGISLFRYDINIHKPQAMSNLSLPVVTLPEKAPPKPHLPPKPNLRPRLPTLPSHIGPVELEVAEDHTKPFVLDHAKERDAKELVRDVDDNLGEFAILCGAMVNAYRGVVTEAPAGLFGSETAAEARDIDRDLERAVRDTSADSSGLWRQILEGFAKYGEASGDPSLAKLQRQMATQPIVLDSAGNAVDVRPTASERRVDRAIARDEAAHVSPWKRMSAIIGDSSSTTLNPFKLVGKKLIPLLSAARPPPRIIATALNHFPRMTSPEGALEVIQNYVSRYVAFNDASKFYIDAIMRAVTPLLFPLLRLISHGISLNLRTMTAVLNHPKLAAGTVAATTYVFRFIGWVWHLIVSIVHTIVRLIAAIVQFVIAIVVSIYASPITGIIINAVVALIIRFVIR